MRKRERMRGRPLHRVFTEVAQSYDLVNRVITLGFDGRWRLEAARSCLRKKPRRILDLCCGTGDLALSVYEVSGGRTTVVGLDLAPAMLAVAKRKRRYSARITLINGDAANLPFADGSFDCVGISFAFRNLVYKNPMSRRYLDEVLRLLPPGGKFVIVESGQPDSDLIRRLFHIYIRTFALEVGHIISRNKGAYRYLAESVTRFYGPKGVESLLVSVGFRKVEFRPLLFGMVAVFEGSKKESEAPTLDHQHHHLLSPA